MNKTVIQTNAAPKAIGPYSQAISVNGLLFISGQLPVDPETGLFPEGGIKEQTEQSLKNLEAILKEVGSGLEQVVKTTVFLTDINDFTAMNEVYSNKFSGSIFPARSAVEVANLPKNALVEIEAIAIC